MTMPTVNQPTILSSKAPEEIVTLTFDYSALYGSNIPTGTVAASASFNVFVLSGTDPSPQAILSGTASFDTSGHVFQNVAGGVDNCTYMIVCYTQFETQVFAASGILPVRGIPS